MLSRRRDCLFFVLRPREETTERLWTDCLECPERVCNGWLCSDCAVLDEEEPWEESATYLLDFRFGLSGRRFRLFGFVLGVLISIFSTFSVSAESCSWHSSRTFFASSFCDTSCCEKEESVTYVLRDSLRKAVASVCVL